jgi:Asp-tRNA(Asn)/Glu-tRNA(Gln) amidotransferase A subunit family amidase
MKLLSRLLSTITAVSAINFDWTFEGERYHAVEVARYPANDSSLSSQISEDGVGYFSVGNVGWKQFETPLEGVGLPNGPYVVAALGDFFVFAKVYNVKSDPALAFMEGAIPDETGTSFSAFPSGVPVPSALGEGPLAGMRFAVKDIFHVEGLKTSGGSRSYYDAYEPQNFTNQVVANSISAGAQLVGKTRTIAFALGTPRNGWEVDYQDPWSLRGDGYQTTGGSSSGSSAAITAYDWLDFTIGSDTGGSVRFPARFAGFYGYKPTHGIFNLTGILPAIAQQDTPGHMARSPSTFVKVGRVWAEDTSLVAPTSFPTQIQYWSDEPALNQTAAEDMKLAFFANVSSALNMSTTSINVTASWNQHISNSTMNSYYYTVYQDQNSAQSWDLIGKPLAEVYGAQNDGAFPPLDPVVNLTWADGQNATTRSRYDLAISKREAYAAWFNNYILPSDPDTCSQSIAAHSLHVPPSTVKYDQTPFRLVAGFYNGMQASFAGFPEIVVPIGQVQYYSPFTQKMEWQTVTVAFAAAKGCDLVLFDLVEKLAEEGLIKEVMAGKVAYPVE